jgi:Protein of unknown function (DUF2442)
MTVVGPKRLPPDVTKVKATPDFCIEAEFATGEIRRFDMRPYLNYPAFSALQERNLFMRVHIRLYWKPILGFC